MEIDPLAAPGYSCVIFSTGSVNKDISTVEGGTTEVLAEFVVGYAVIPLAGFDYVIHHPGEYKYDSNHTFKQVLPVIARLSGEKYIPPPTVDDFVWVPLPTNVYTCSNTT